MSRTAVLGVAPDRRPVELLGVANGFGWSPSIWGRLMKHRYGFDGYLFGGEGGTLLDRLWREIEDMPPWQQVPNVLTFDTGVIPGEEARWAADQLDEFERRLPAPPGHANHVPAVAELLRSRPEVPFIGMWGTSVSSNPFDPWDEEADAPGTGIPLDAMYLLERHRDQAGVR